MDKITKLSQAIRLGATFRPQCYKTPFDYVGSCVLGAAYEAITGIRSPSLGSYSMRVWLAMRFGLDTDDLLVIVEMNDRWHMTREQIADWLEAKGL